MLWFKFAYGSRAGTKGSLGAFINATSRGISTWFLCVRQRTTGTTRYVRCRLFAVRLCRINCFLWQIRSANYDFTVCRYRVHSFYVIYRVVVRVLRECLFYFVGNRRVVIRSVVFYGISRTISMYAITRGRWFIFKHGRASRNHLCTVDATSLRRSTNMLVYFSYDRLCRSFACFLCSIGVMIFVPYTPINRRNYFCTFEDNWETKNWGWM